MEKADVIGCAGRCEVGGKDTTQAGDPGPSDSPGTGMIGALCGEAGILHGPALDSKNVVDRGVEATGNPWRGETQAVRLFKEWRAGRVIERFVGEQSGLELASYKHRSREKQKDKRAGH